MPSYGELVASAALVLTGVGLAWQLRRAVRDRPRLAVAAVPVVDVAGRDLPVRRSLALVVTNDGRRGTTVIDVGWETEDEPGTRFSLALLRADDDLARRFADAVTGPALPCRLGASDEAEWTFAPPAVAVVAGERVRPVARGVRHASGRRRADPEVLVRGEWLDLPPSWLAGEGGAAHPLVRDG